MSDFISFSVVIIILSVNVVNFYDITIFTDLRLLITPLVQILIQIRKHKIPHCLFKTQYYLQAIAQCKNIQKTVKKISDNATHD
jgi:hypothetical protein